MAEGYTGNKHLTGTHGKLWWDGYPIFEIKKFESKVKPKRETIYVDMDEDSKIVSLAGEGSFTVQKIFSRGMKKLLESYNAGQDPRATLTGLLSDPDAVGKQQERVTYHNVWFTELTLQSFEKGAVIEQEFPFGFTPSTVDMQDEIAIP